MWLSLVPSLIKTGMSVFSNHQASKIEMSKARLRHSTQMANGEIEYQGMVMDSNDKGWKDEAVLIVVSMPILLLVWSIFSEDPEIRDKLNLFFEYFNSFPLWYQGIFVGIVGSIYGLKTMSLLKK